VGGWGGRCGHSPVDVAPSRTVGHDAHSGLRSAAVVPPVPGARDRRGVRGSADRRRPAAISFGDDTVTRHVRAQTLKGRRGKHRLGLFRSLQRRAALASFPLQVWGRAFTDVADSTLSVGGPGPVPTQTHRGTGSELALKDALTDLAESLSVGGALSVPSLVTPQSLGTAGSHPPRHHLGLIRSSPPLPPPTPPRRPSLPTP
jgi:hypothetical protein